MNQARLRVAVVDDEESVRRAIGRLLRSAGMDVETHGSGQEFLRSTRTGEFGCLVLDLHMPSMDGFEVHEALVRSGSRLPVVIITGHDKPEYRAKALAVGVSAYLTKPVDDCELLAAIGVAAQGRGEEDR